MSSLRARLGLAIAVSVLALVAVIAISLGGNDRTVPSESTSSTSDASTPSTTETTVEVTTTSIELQPDWYPKGSSRYSDRQAQTTTVPAPGAGSRSGGSEPTGVENDVGSDAGE